MTQAKYPCSECLGRGQCTCECCGTEGECENCDGTGLDPERYDIDKIQAATKAANKSGLWEAREDGVVVGWQDGSGVRVRFADYEKPEPSP